MIYDVQKASLLKRFSAFLLDLILLSILAAGFGWLLSAATGYDSYAARLDDSYRTYEARYGVTFDLTEEQYNALDKQARDAYDTAYRALLEDAETMHCYRMVLNLTLLITSLGILCADLVLEFFLPMAFRNGQTVGKKIFGIAVMRTDGVRISNLQLFVRTVLGKYTIETMIPVLIGIMIWFNSIGVVGVIVLGLILLLQIVLLAATRENSLLHDLLAGTVCVDLSSQLIFPTTEDMLEYKKKAAAERAAREPY